MIQPLRAAHFRIWLALAVLLPALWVAGLMARRSSTPKNAEFHWEKIR